MTLPLVVLAGAAAVGGLLNLPLFKQTLFLEHFLEPSFGEALEHHTVATGTKVGLALAATAAAVGGIAIAYALWFKKEPAENASLEPAILKRAWAVNDVYAAVIGGPGRAVASFAAFVIDKGIIDGAVNGLATVVRAGGGGLRRLQTGYVRNYALGLAGGAVLLLAWTVARVSA